MKEKSLRFTRGGKKKKFVASDSIFILTFVVLLVYSLSLLWLVLWGLTSSFKDYYSDFSLGNAGGFPKKIVFSNYKLVFENFCYEVVDSSGAYKINAFGLIEYTLLYAVGSAFFTTVTPCVVAYVVSRFGKKYKWLNVYTSVVLVCLILPIVGNYPSELRVVRMLGLYDSIFGIWIMKSHFLSMYYMVFLGTFSSMPDGYAEAAKIDGAGNFTVFFRIYLPLVRNLFFTVMLLQGIYFWNDFQTPLLYLPTYPTLAYWLYRFTENTKVELSFVPVKAAGAMLLVVPIFILFAAFNKKMMGNLSLGGLKE